MFDEQLKKQYPISTSFLTNAIKKNKLANSYIFIGKDDNDKKHFAINLAKILNCKENKEKYKAPCNTCVDCKWIENNSHPQALRSIKPDHSSKKEQIKIDEIRDLLKDLNINSGYFRIILFENSNFSSLPPESCNLLLKIVEEPPEKIIFIFASTSKSEILPTILSRSQIIFLSKKLEKSYDLNNQEIYKKYKSNILPNTLREAIENAKELYEYLKKNKISLKEFLPNLLKSHFETVNSSNFNDDIFIYNTISQAYNKSKAFMQDAFVIEDMFFQLATYSVQKAKFQSSSNAMCSTTN